MKPSIALLLFSSTALLADTSAPPAMQTACGPDRIKFNVASAGREVTVSQPEAGKALVYVIEEFAAAPNELITPTVRVGVDGAWVGANRGTSHISFAVEPGEHHLCADWQSPPTYLPSYRIPMSVAAHSLNAETGMTYYFRARIVEHSGTVFTLDFDRLDADEGQLLVARSPRSDFHPKK